jgi:hypothetical protein
LGKEGEEETERLMPSKTEVELDDGVRPDISQFYPFKDAIERFLGHSEFMKIKDIGGYKALKAAVLRLLRQIEISNEATVTVVDEAWRTEVADIFAHGRDRIEICKTAGDLFACLSATLAELCLLQIGLVPNQRMRKKPLPLKVQNWNLASFRSVQYVQSDAQKKWQQDALKQRTARMAAGK